MFALSDRNEWDVLLRAKLRLEPGVIFRTEETIRPGEIAPAGLAWDPAAGKSYLLAPWHCHFLRMVAGGFPMEEIVRVVSAFFPAAAGRERIREFVFWLGDKKLAGIEWPDLSGLQSFSAGNASEPHGRADREGKGALAPGNGPSDRVKIAGRGNRSGKARKRRRECIYGAIGTAAVLALGIAAGNHLQTISAGRPAEAPREDAVRLVAPKLAEMIPIRAAAPGILTEMLVRDGDRIGKGDVVARIQDAAARKRVEDLRRDLGEYRMRRDASYRAGDREAYLELVHTIVRLSQKIGEQEAGLQPVELRSPVSGEVEQDGFIGRKVGDELGGGETIVKVRVDPGV